MIKSECSDAKLVKNLFKSSSMSILREIREKRLNTRERKVITHYEYLRPFNYSTYLIQTYNAYNYHNILIAISDRETTFSSYVYM